MAVLPNLEQQNADLKAQLAALQAQLAKKATISCKVSEKGALSVYGLGRFPVTLYRSQWEALFAAKDRVVGFMAANESSLKSKE